MDKIFNAMDRYPGRTIAGVMATNVVIFLGGVVVVALAARYVFTGHIG